MGLYGFDSPRSLLCHTLMKIKTDKPDVIILNGDFIAHGVTLTDRNASQEQKLAKWEEMKVVLSTAMREIRTKLIGVDILPSIGNNDVIVHYQVPCREDLSQIYYQDIFDIMFPKFRLPRYFKYDAVKETFLKGGYYRHDFGIEKISLISLNSMYFAEQNQCMFNKGEEQLQWLREQL